MITPFNPSVIARAVEVVDRSGADKELLRLLRPGGRGRPPEHNTRAFLVGAILAVQWKGSLVIRDIHRVLSENLPLDIQYQLGVLDQESSKELFTQKHVYKLVEAFGGYLEFGDGSEPDLADDERARRRESVLELLHSMIAVTLPKSNSTSRAIDGSGIWSWGRMPRKVPDWMLKADSTGDPLILPVRDDMDDHEDGDDEDSDGENRQTAWSTVKKPHDPDAGYGIKTRKDGKREGYYGYQLHALVRVPDKSEQKGVIPLFETFELTPAPLDVVEPSLGLIDRATSMGNTITDLLGDRHYSYKAPDRWYDELQARGVRQHVDLHPMDQGFSPYDGMKVAAAWMHCPATPKDLGVIPSVGPTATPEAKAKFAEDIKERRKYAFRRLGRLSMKADGTYQPARWMCPAAAGTVGCVHHPGTVEVAQLNGLPVIAKPPAESTRPKCCRQATVSTGPDAPHKVEQEHYWGSPEWRGRYNARTYVEGAFGNVKNPTTENVERGFFRVTGLAKVTLCVGLALVAHNLRMLRGNTELFAVGAGDLLLQEDADCRGFMFVSEDEEAVILEFRREQSQAVPDAAAARPTNGEQVAE